jgi:hypothetical protein
LVVADTQGWSDRPPPEVPADLDGPLAELGATLDVPARLLSGPDGENRQQAVRTAVTAAFALAAHGLEPDGRLPFAENPANRERLGWVVSQAYAHFATPRLVAALFPNGRPDDLGSFPLPVPEGDVAAARALALAIGARTGAGEEQVLTRLVAAGRNGVGPAAADMLLRLHPGYAQLPQLERDALLRSVSNTVESGFAARNLEAAAQRELTAVRENRRPDIAGGAAAIDAASRVAGAEVRELHAFLDKRSEWDVANQQRSAARDAARPVGAPLGRPESVPQLMQRVSREVGVLTGTRNTLWNGVTDYRPNNSGVALVLSPEQAAALGRLVGGAQLTPEDAVHARAGMLTATAEHAKWAVPDGHTPRNEAAAAGKYLIIESAVVNAFAEDNLDRLIDRTLPPEQAAQLRSDQAPTPDARGHAARALASAIDAATDLPAGETLRRMAGEERSGMALTAAAVIVAASDVEPTERPFAEQLIADELNMQFDKLPSSSEKPERYGHAIGRLAIRTADTFALSPGWARDLVVGSDPMLRFAQDYGTPRTVRTPESAPQAGSGVDRPGKPGLGRG